MENTCLHVLSKMIYGIYVLTTFRGEEINGMIASWVSQISYDPPMVIAAIHPNRYSHQMIHESAFFALHLLSREKKDLLSCFKNPDPGLRFSSLKWTRGKTGCPILKDCVGYMECEVKDEMEPGNHTLFLGEVVAAEIFSNEVPMSTLDYEGVYFGKS